MAVLSTGYRPLASCPAQRAGAQRLCALAPSRQEERGRAGLLCPDSSDVDLLGYGKSVIDLNTKVAHRALDLFMPQQELYCSQIASAPVNEGRLGSA